MHLSEVFRINEADSREFRFRNTQEIEFLYTILVDLEQYLHQHSDPWNTDELTEEEVANIVGQLDPNESDLDYLFDKKERRVIKIALERAAKWDRFKPQAQAIISRLGRV